MKDALRPAAEAPQVSQSIAIKEGTAVGGDNWSVLMTDSTGAASGPISPDGLQMLRVESELAAEGIQVGWDPFRPGEGFQGFYVNVAWPRPLHLLVKDSDLPRATEILQSLQADDESSSLG
jgi:hypothetical protein